MLALGLDLGAPQFSVNEHCAGGTGSFFEDQMFHLGLNIEDYSRLVVEAQSIPRLSGRCAVFAKTDIIHRQQEGVPTPDILLGLCYAMMCGLREACKAPLLELFFDHGWDETAWASVRSFLYYCR